MKPFFILEYKQGRPCGVGHLIQQKGGLKILNPDASKEVLVEDLEDLGPWPF